MINIFLKQLIEIYNLGFNYIVVKLNSIILNDIIDFIILNKYIYFFILLTYFLLWFDKRFYSKKSKIIILIIIAFLIILFTYLCLFIDINNLPLFFSELFWYSKLINLAFIIHVLWLHWIYNIFWYYRCEKICWFISRISFIFSLSFLMFLISYLDLSVGKYRKNYQSRLIWKQHENPSICVFTVDDLKRSKKIAAILKFILSLFRSIVGFFITLFWRYVSLIFGFKDISRIGYRNIILMCLFIIVTFIISYYILGIARLYVVWIFFFIYNSYQVFILHINRYVSNKDRLINNTLDYEEEKKELIIIFLKVAIRRNYSNLLKIKYEEIWEDQNIFSILKDFFNYYLLYYYREDVDEKQKKFIKDTQRYYYKFVFLLPQYYYLYLNKKNSGFEFLNYLYYFHRVFIYKNWLKWCEWTLFEIWIREIRHDYKTFENRRKILDALKAMTLYYRLDKTEVIYLRKVFIEDIYKLLKNGKSYKTIFTLYEDKFF